MWFVAPGQWRIQKSLTPRTGRCSKASKYPSKIPPSGPLCDLHESISWNTHIWLDSVEVFGLLPHATFQIFLLKFKPAMWCLIVTSTRCCSTSVKITSFLSFKVFGFCQFPHSKYPEIILPSISRKEILSCCCKPPGEKHAYLWISLVLWSICPHLGITIWIYVCQDDF